jgi:hypothetical protein|tara:strand:+ start:227 stop:616 length:390 start_codon:yes stop_codon:yes gene_type:complete
MLNLLELKRIIAIFIVAAFLGQSFQYIPLKKIGFLLSHSLHHLSSDHSSAVALLGHYVHDWEDPSHYPLSENEADHFNLSANNPVCVQNSVAELLDMPGESSLVKKLKPYCFSVITSSARCIFHPPKFS